MWFQRPEETPDRIAFPGETRVLDGWSALLETERIASEVLVVAPEHRANGFPVSGDAPTFSDTTTGVAPSPARTEFLRVKEARGAGDVVASLSGYAMRGVRAGALMADTDGLAPGLAAAAGRRVPFVVHLSARARTRQAQALRGSHDAYHSLSGSGAFLMFARNAQEVADYALIARRAAERALAPGVCAHDLYATSHAVRGVTLAGADLVAAYLGHATDTIPAPGDAQRLLFGDSRRRIPLLLDPARPAGIGGAQDAESFFRAEAAARAYFDADLARTIDDAMAEFGALTGRSYQRVAGYRVDDADFVVVAQGAIVDELVRVVDLLRERKVKAGIVNVAVLRPFPARELARLLQGRRVVTVLECVQAPFFNTPLAADVRAALECDNEDSRARNRNGRTMLLSGFYGAGTSVPGFAQLISVFDNMSTATPRHSYSLGAGFDVETRRFPHLQTLQQRLEREYPAALRTSLDTAAPPTPPRQNDGSVTIVSPSAQGALFAGNLFARALAGATGWNVHSYPDGGLDRSMQPAQFSVVFARNGLRVSRPVMNDAVLVSNECTIETVAATGGLRRNGTLIAASVRGPEVLWRGLSKRTADWVRAESLSFHALDARRLAADAALHASFVDQLAIWALLGAYTRIHLNLSTEQTTRIEQCLRDELRAAPDLAQASIDEIVQVFRRGAETHAAVRHEDWKDAAHPLGEPETPWTVQASATRDGSVFDASRFWHSVGYLYDRGQPGLALADPYLATGIMPAGSSAFRDMTPTRLRLPSWLAENCTACGNCWTQCPETALPATARTVPELIGAAIAAAERNGAVFVQLKRLADNLAKFATRVVAQGGPRPDASLSAILSEAFARLMDKAGLDGERTLAARAEFERMCDAIDGLHVAATETLFAKAQSGRLLALALNPLACNACGICVAECADGALEWVEQTPQRVAAARRSWEFLLQLPAQDEGAIVPLLSDDDADTQTRRLLDTDAYHALVGGDGSVPGSGARTAVHLVSSTMESVLRSNGRAHVQSLDALIGAVENRIQGRIQSGFRVNDFEEFSHRLQRLGRAEITPAALTGIMGDDGTTIDAAQIASLTQLLNALRAQRERHQAGPARFLITVDPEDGGFWHGTYPFNPHAQPWAAQRAGDAIALATATAETLAAERVQEAALCRRASAAVNDADQDAGLSWDTLTREERALTPRVLVLVRPHTLNAQRVRDVLAGTLPIVIVVVDPDGVTDCDATASADALMLSLARERQRVAQGSIGAAGHLMRCVVDALDNTEPTLLRVYAPEPVGSGVAPERIPELARAAVASGAVPAFSCLDGSCHVAPVEHDAVLTLADWAAMQARFRHHFRVVSKGHRSDRTRRLAAYLKLDAAAREGIQPFIDVVDARGQEAIALVSNQMASLSERVAARWAALRPDVSATREKAPAPVDAEPAPTAVVAAVSDDALRALTENLLRLGGLGNDDAFFKRSLREFVARGRAGANGGRE